MDEYNIHIPQKCIHHHPPCNSVPIALSSPQVTHRFKDGHAFPFVSSNSCQAVVSFLRGELKRDPVAPKEGNVPLRNSLAMVYFFSIIRIVCFNFDFLFLYFLSEYFSRDTCGRNYLILSCLRDNNKLNIVLNR